MTIECDCPFCPLVARKVQVCDVEVEFPTKNTVKTKGIPDQYTDLRQHFIILALYYKNNKKVCKKGDSMTTTREGEFRLTAECKKKNHIKLCFHTEGLEDSDDEEEEEEEDEWMDVYHHTNDFSPYCGNHEHLQPYKNFRYFQCWGGGGDGGFIMNDKDETYRVNRDWFQPFTVEPVKGKIDILESEGHMRLRIVE